MNARIVDRKTYTYIASSHETECEKISILGKDNLAYVTVYLAVFVVVTVIAMDLVHIEIHLRNTKKIAN